MRAAAIVLVLALLASGCTRPSRSETRVGEQPYGWDEDAPERSELSTQPYYVLSQSSSFLVKGASYARYVVRVDREHQDVGVFFTSTNRNAPPDVARPNVKDDEYHYEFMQLRPLGKTIRLMDVNAGPAFRNASTGHAYTLTYIYGRGANYQYVAPFDGDPGKWTLSPGFYELIVATDEKLTVGVNLRLNTPLWTTHYHPQELGASRAAALETYVKIFAGSTPRSLHESFERPAVARAGESLNYFAFASLFHRSNLVTVGAQGTVRVRVDDQEVPHRLADTGVHASQPSAQEAYAYAVSFNQSGPARHYLRTYVDFEQVGSFNSDLVAQMLVFAVALEGKERHAAIPLAAAP